MAPRGGSRPERDSLTPRWSRLPTASAPLRFACASGSSSPPAFGCWHGRRKKVSRAGLRRPRAVFAQSEAYYAAPCRLGRPESHKDGAVPDKPGERRVIQRYAVLYGLLWCYIDSGSNCMVQCGVIQLVAVQLVVRLRWKEAGRHETEGDDHGV